MPMFRCANPICSTYLPHRGYCAEHKPQGQGTPKQFYDSAAWQRARKIKLANTPWCERCQRVWAIHVHHKVPVKVATNEERTGQQYLVSLCVRCHSETEAELERGGS